MMMVIFLAAFSQTITFEGFNKKIIKVKHAVFFTESFETNRLIQRGPTITITRGEVKEGSADVLSITDMFFNNDLKDITGGPIKNFVHALLMSDQTSIMMTTQ